MKEEEENQRTISLQRSLAIALEHEQTGQTEESEKMLLSLKEQYPEYYQPSEFLSELYLKYGYKIPSAREMETSIRKGNRNPLSLETMVRLSKELDGWKDQAGNYEILLQQETENHRLRVQDDQKKLVEYFSIDPSELPLQQFADHWLQREDMLLRKANVLNANHQTMEAIKAMEQRIWWSKNVDIIMTAIQARELRQYTKENLETIAANIYRNARGHLDNERYDCAVFDIALARQFREPDNDDERSTVIDVAIQTGIRHEINEAFTKNMAYYSALSALTEEKGNHLKTGAYLIYLTNKESVGRMLSDKNTYELRIKLDSHNIVIKNVLPIFNEDFDPHQYAAAALICGDRESAKKIYWGLLDKGQLNREDTKRFSRIIEDKDHLRNQDALKSIFENNTGDIGIYTNLRTSLIPAIGQKYQEKVNEKVLELLEKHPDNEIFQTDAYKAYRDREDYESMNEQLRKLQNNEFVDKNRVIFHTYLQHLEQPDTEIMLKAGQIIQEIAPTQSSGHTLQALARIKRGEFPEAEEQMEKILEHPNKYEFFQIKSFYHLYRKEFLEIIENYFTAASENIQLDRSDLIIPFKALKGAQNTIREIKERGNLASGVLQEILVTLLDYTQQEKESVQATKELCSYLLKEKESHDAILSSQALEPVGLSSKNDVVTLNNSPLSSNIYIIKRRNHHLYENAEDARRRLEQEYAINTFITSAIDDDELRAKLAAPIALFSEGGETFFFQKRMGGKHRLEELMKDLKPQEKEKQLLATLETWGDIQNAAMRYVGRNGPTVTVSDGLEQYTIDLKTTDKVEELMGKLFIGRPTDVRPRLGVNEYTAPFMQEYRKFIGYDDRLFRKKKEDPLFLIHNELFLTNILQGGNPIDFEKAGMGNPLRDFYSLVDHPSNEGVDLKRLKAAYLKRITPSLDDKELKQRILDDDKKERTYNNLRSLGIALHQDKQEQAIYHVKKLVEQFDGRLRDRFISCVMASEYEHIKQAIK
jgi:hypothetical protein